MIARDLRRASAPTIRSFAHSFSRPHTPHEDETNATTHKADGCESARDAHGGVAFTNAWHPNPVSRLREEHGQRVCPPSESSSIRAASSPRLMEPPSSPWDIFLISLESGLHKSMNKLRVAACALPRTPRLAQLASTTPPIDRPRAARRIFSQFFFPAPRTRVIGRPKSPITKSAAAARKPRRGSRQCTGGSGFPSGWRW